MLSLDSIVLYVDNINNSIDFYTKLFNCNPVLLSPTFAQLNCVDNTQISLKLASQLNPKSSVKGGGTELSLHMPDKVSFDRLFNTWKQLGVQFEQECQAAVYGHNFVAKDLDEHRIRVFTQSV